MEFIIYTAVTITLWVLSVSLLLPFAIFLKCSKTYRDMWFSWFFAKLVIPASSLALRKTRKRAFELLKKHLPDTKRKPPLEILEIGVGGGFNLEFYPENSNLTALDMNESFIKYFDKNRKKHIHVTHKRTVIAMAEDMHEVDDASMDVVVCTYVLCSVKNIPAVLNEVKRVLKPGGKFLFLEHVMYPKFTWQATLQRLANPLWKIYFDGCELIKKTDEEVRKTGFSEMEIDRKYPTDFWVYTRPHVLGIATKQLF